jgi:LPS export ABC transporter protein LptC/lipopolysaccharide transport protein LptA
MAERGVKIRIVRPSEAEAGGARPPSTATRLRRRRRWLQLGALVGIVGVIAAVLFYLAQAGREEPVPAGTAEAAANPDLLLEGKGVDFSIERDGRTVFRIRGARVQQDRADNVFLQEVTVNLERENGDRYKVESGRATYNRDTGEAVLEGRVTLTGPGGLRVETSRLALGERGQVATSDQPVALRYARKLIGRAGRLAADFRRDEILLAGGVRLDSLRSAPRPFRLRTDQLRLDRAASQIRAEGAVTVGWDRNALSCERLSAVFTPDMETLRYLNAHWQVSGELFPEGIAPPVVASASAEPAAGADAVPDGEISVAEEIAAAEAAPAAAPMAVGEPIRYQGTSLILVLDDRERLERLELEGGAGKAQLTSTDPAKGLARLVEASTLVATFGEGELQVAETFGGSYLRETVGGGSEGKETVTREARADRGEARFSAAHQVSSVTLQGTVDFRQGTFQATAERADVEMDGGLIELHGTPVTLADVRGRLEAPHVVVRQDKGLLHADQGVHARFEPGGGDGGLLGSALGASKGPILVDAVETLWYDAPRSFVFLGKVQAWQGENLLLAEQLRGDQTAGRFAASGGVKTLWYPTNQVLGQPAATAGAPAGVVGPPEPIEITARDLEYLESPGKLTYTGTVAARQVARTLACEQLTVDLDDERRAERLGCDGKVRLEDKAQLTVVTGDKAIYDLAAKTVVVTGQKVEMQNRGGNRVSGRELIYDTTKGTARMGVGAPTAPVAAPTAGGAAAPPVDSNRPEDAGTDANPPPRPPR